MRRNSSTRGRLLFVILLPATIPGSGTPTWAGDAAIAADTRGASAVPNWPQFRGPNATGVADDGAYPAQIGPETNLLWKTPLPSGVSSPCVWGDRIFLTCFEKASKTLATVCIDRNDGRTLWRREVPSEQIEEVHEVSSPANSTPATDGQRMYAYFASYGLVCYDMEGNQVWQKPLPFRRIAFGNGSSPIVAGGMVILNLDDGGRWVRDDDGEWQQRDLSARIVAIEAESGTTVWKTPRAANNRRYASPALWQHSAGSQVVLFGRGRLDGYDLATGKPLWQIEDLPPQSCATPLVVGDHVYLTTTGIFGERETYVRLPAFEAFLEEHDQDGDGLIDLDEIPEDRLIIDRRASRGAGNSKLADVARSIDRDQDRAITKEEWDTFIDRSKRWLDSDPGLYAIQLDGTGEVTTDSIRWHQTRGVTEVPTPLIYNGRLYVVRNGGIVHCRDAGSGHELFGGRLGATGGYYASPVAADGKVYFASDRGVMTVIADDEKLTLLSQADLGEPIMATPALVAGNIYVRTDANLYAFGVAEGD